MIYVSAQPDKLQFLWQLEVQIFNFRRVGILDSQIHILIGVNGGLSEYAKVFKVKYPTVGIFFYRAINPPYYISAIRPNLLAQHFERFPQLEQETIFYHDSDIIFRELPVLKDFDCLASDTHGYTGPQYINSKGPDLLRAMCAICQISPSAVCEENSGGAQYVLIGVNSEFWRKVEIDCLSIYQYLSRNQDGPNPIQKWCSDMWAMQYNILYFGHHLATDKELTFCWATDEVAKWDKTKIYHDAGVIAPGKQFYKGEFRTQSPIGLNHDVDPQYCSVKYVEEINRLHLEDQVL